MDNDIILARLMQIIKEFGKEFGFQLCLMNSQTGFTEIYLCQKHALLFTIDWRDYLIDVCIFRTEEGIDPRVTGKTYVDQSGRRYRIPIDEVYDTRYPFRAGDDCWSEKAMILVLNHYLNVIRKKPSILFDYMANIEKYTTVEYTKQAHHKALLRRAENLKQDYLTGRIDKEAYDLIFNRLLQQIQGLQNS